MTDDASNPNESPASEGAAAPPAAAAPSASEKFRGVSDGGGAEAASSRPLTSGEPHALAKQGWFGWQFPLGIGVAAIGAASLRAGIVAKAAADAGQKAEAWWWAAGRIALLAPLGAALGLAAAWVLARSLRRPLGEWKLAAARMLAAVGLFHLVWRLGANPSGLTWFDAAFAFSLAFACYLGTLALTFRLKRDELLQLTAVHAGFVVAAHALIWVTPKLFTTGAKAPEQSAPAVAPSASPPTATRPKLKEETPAAQPPPPPAQQPAPAPAEQPANTPPTEKPPPSGA